MPRRKHKKDKNAADRDNRLNDDGCYVDDRSNEESTQQKTSNQPERCGKLEKTNMMTPGTLPGVYDLAGENTRGIYDLSSDQRVSRTSKYRSSENLDGRTWLAIDRQKMIIMGVVTACLIVGIGIPVVLMGGNGGKAQESPPQSTSSKPKIGK